MAKAQFGLLFFLSNAFHMVNVYLVMPIVSEISQALAMQWTKPPRGC